MLLFFEPTIVAKTTVTLLQSPPLPSFNVDIWTTDAARDWIFCYSATLNWGKEDNKNIKVDFLVLH